MVNHSYKSVNLLITFNYPFHELFANSVSRILFANVLVSILVSGSRVQLEAGETAQQLRTCSALPENSSLVPSTHGLWLTAAWISSCSGYDSTEPPWAPAFLLHVQQVVANRGCQLDSTYSQLKAKQPGTLGLKREGRSQSRTHPVLAAHPKERGRRALLPFSCLPSFSPASSSLLLLRCSFMLLITSSRF